MTDRKNFIPGVVVAAVLLLGVLVAIAVLGAQDRGRNALSRNQEAAVSQLAASMDKRIATTLESISGIASQPFTFAKGDSSDQARLQALQDLNPDPKSGMILVRPNKQITSGTLLEATSPIGSILSRPGLDEALEASSPTLLPAARGATTRQLTIALVYPVRDPKTSQLQGAFIFESVVATDSSFNQEIRELKQGDTGIYSFVDSRGTVIVSTEDQLVGQPFDPALGAGPTGLERNSGTIIAREDVPSADWRLVFTQDLQEFEAGLGQQVQVTLLLLVFAIILSAAAAFIVVARRMRAERAERIRISELNRTREEFISIVSHELRTPVAGLAGFLESALDHWSMMDDETKKQAVKRGQASARRLQALTRDVLDSSSVESGEFSYSFASTDLVAEVEAAVISSREASPGQEITFTTASNKIWVNADPDRIQQVVLNLLENATKNSPRDSRIDVAIELRPDRAMVSVTDHGAGIDLRDREQIFEKWVRGRSTVHGSGLGLYVSRKIVQAHHGDIWNESVPGGEAFRFTIPLIRRPAETVSI